MATHRLTRPRPRSITAAGVRIDTTAPGKGPVKPRTAEQWKVEAWMYFDAVPEVKFAARFLGNALARLRFYPAITVEHDDSAVALADATVPREPTDGDPGDPYISEADAAIIEAQFARLAQGPDGMQGIQREFAINTTIAGECNLIGRDVDGHEEWAIFPESSVKRSDVAGEYIILDPDTGEKRTLNTGEDGSDFAARIWRRHSNKPWLSDSNMRAVLDVCEELLIYNRTLRAVGKSRNPAGILLLPTELDFEDSGVVEFADDDDDEETPDAVANPDEAPDGLTPFERGIVMSFGTPTTDDGSAGSVAPHILRGAAEFLKEVRLVALERSIDPEVLARIDHLIHRLAHGLDVPVEILTGVAEATHWTAWQIEDSTYKAHVEPLASILAQAIATTFLRQASIDAGLAPDLAERVVVGIDPADLVVRPNRTADVQAAFDSYAASFKALRQAYGIPDSDAPDDDEIALRYALLNPGSAFQDPSTGDAGGSPIPATQDDAAAGDDGTTPVLASGAPTAAGTQASDLGARLAGIDARLRERLQAAASAALSAALARAGARLRAAVQGDPGLAKRTRGVDNSEIGQVLGTGHADPAELLTAGDFDGLHHQWDAWVDQARAQAITAVRAEGMRRLLDPEQIDSAIAEMQASQDGDRDTGWAVLLASLLDSGRRRIFTPDEPPDRGEFDAHMSVSAGEIRRALAVMGDGGLSGDGENIAGGPATGGQMMRLGVGFALGAATIAYVWVAGSSDRPFEPHQALDGLLLSGEDDPQLLYDGWPADENGGFLAVSDHDGCTCSLDPVIAFVLPDGSVEEE